MLERGDRSILALSYGWLTALHPDPHGTTLAAVRRFLDADAAASDTGLFWDFCSLPQKGPDGDDKTEAECLDNLLFGLPKSNIGRMQSIGPDTDIFLLNYNSDKVHGVFRSVAKPALNIDQLAWGGQKGKGSPWPAQLKVERSPGLHFEPTLLNRRMSMGKGALEGPLRPQKVQALLQLLSSKKLTPVEELQGVEVEQ